MNFDLEEGQQLLERTPTLVQTMLSDLPDQWIHNNEGEGTWSPYDIVGHLIHGEKTDWIPRTRIILSDSADKHFIPFDRFAQMENNNQPPTLKVLLEAFSQLRTSNLEELRSMEINEEKMNRTGIHPDFGRVTLKQLLATWVVHDLSHIHQISRVLAKNYQSEVGPWTKYISMIQ